MTLWWNRVIHFSDPTLNCTSWSIGTILFVVIGGESDHSYLLHGIQCAGWPRLFHSACLRATCKYTELCAKIQHPRQSHTTERNRQKRNIKRGICAEGLEKGSLKTCTLHFGIWKPFDCRLSSLVTLIFKDTPRRDILDRNGCIPFLLHLYSINTTKHLSIWHHQLCVTEKVWWLMKKRSWTFTDHHQGKS